MLSSCRLIWAMSPCLIGLGSNLENRRATLDLAVQCLANHPAIRLKATSCWHETPPIGGPPGQRPFLNGAAVVETALSPTDLLQVLQQIETDLGRRRTERWGPRSIDLDLLLYGDLVLTTPFLVLPHPQMAWRRFVLGPAAEVAAEMIHPPTGWTVGRLLEHLDTAASYVAITGSIGAGKTQLAEQLAERTSARLIREPMDVGLLEAFYGDPPSRAWETELEFLQQRTRLLAADSPQWSDRTRLTVSDFWLGQSLAFARVWLPPQRREAYRRHWERSQLGVIRPKLIVLLEAPGERLLKRVIRRGRPYERDLTEQQLERIGRAIAGEAASPDQGPVLKIMADDADRVLQETAAAVAAME